MCEIKEKEYSFLSNNQYSKIYVKMWIPQGEIKAILQLAHGMNEHMGRYEEFAKYLAQRGILVVGNDHMGHGNSVSTPEDYGYFAYPVVGGTKAQREKYSSSALAVRDMYKITKTVKKHYPGIPYYLLGHSMGSMLSQRYAVKYGSELQGMILMGIVYVDDKLILPGRILWKIITLLKGERHRSKLYHKLIFGEYTKRIPNPKTEFDWLFTDEEELKTFMNDKKTQFIFTMNGFRVLTTTYQYIQKKTNLAKIPKDLRVLILSGSEDPCGNYGEYLNKLCATYKGQGIKDVFGKLYVDCRHELIHESLKHEVFKDIESWILKSEAD